MHVLVILILATADYQRKTAGASGVCQPPVQEPYTIAVTKTFPINKTIRIQCVDGYVRKVGTSNLLRCIEKQPSEPTWEPAIKLKCIPDPKKSMIRPEQNFTTSTTERTHTSAISGTSTSTAATAFSATNEVAATQTTAPRTTNLPTMKITTKETRESISTSNEIPSPTPSTCTSSQYMTTRSSPSQSIPFTTATGVNMLSKTSTTSGESDIAKKTFGTKTSTIGGAAGIILLGLAAGVFLILWRFKHRATNTTNEFQLDNSNQATCTYYTPVPVSDTEHCSAEPNVADTTDTTDSK